MSKLNKAGAAKIAAIGRKYSNGDFNVNGVYQGQYSLGRDAWFSGAKYSSLWSKAFKEGWRAARDADIAFANQCPSARDRVLERMGILQPDMVGKVA